MSSKSGIGPLKRDSSDLVVGDYDKAELLSRYFKFLLPMIISIMMLSHVLIQTTHMSSVVFNPQCVLNVLLTLNVNSSGGPDRIKPILLKNT